LVLFLLAIVLSGLIEFVGNYTIGNIQVCYAAALPVSIVERS
jgi:hypothetical protein